MNPVLACRVAGAEQAGHPQGGTVSDVLSRLRRDTPLEQVAKRLPSAS